LAFYDEVARSENVDLGEHAHHQLTACADGQQNRF
jgi:hypothetical protein